VVMAVGFLERIAAVENGEETSFVARGGEAAVLRMGNLLLSRYRSHWETLPSSNDGLEVKLFGWRFHYSSIL
jgi:hypothetical protein